MGTVMLTCKVGLIRRYAKHFAEAKKKYNLGILHIDDKYQYDFPRILRFILEEEKNIENIDNKIYWSYDAGSDKEPISMVFHIGEETSNIITFVTISEVGLILFLYNKSMDEVYCRYIDIFDTLQMLATDTTDDDDMNLFFFKLDNLTLDDRSLLIYKHNTYRP